MTNYYAALGVSRSASQAEIRRAYAKKMQSMWLCGDDISDAPKAKFESTKEAYMALCNYDTSAASIMDKHQICLYA